MKVKMLCLLVVVLVGLTSVGYSQVRDYPKKQIQIVVGHQAGSAIDVFYRLLGEEAGRMWKVPVNIINKPAASGSLGANEVANSEKDGYTLFGTLVGQLASLSVANPKSPVHILRDFDPIEMHSYAAQVVIVKADSKFKGLEEVVEEARKRPGELLCGVTQMGSNLHLEALLLNRLAKINITLIHQEGPPAIVTGVLGGHFDLGFNNDVVARPYVTAGKMRVLVSDIKSSLGCPTFADKGYPQINMFPVMALMGPKGLPPAAIKTWEEALDVILKDPKFTASVTKLGFNISMTTGTEKLNKRLREEVENYSRFTPEELGWKK